MIRNLFFVLSIIFVAAAAAPTAATAQDQEESENSLLPEIDPQDIEIRSQFRASFPGLRRQPILGFDPSPRVYQIDPNRMPFMESEEQVVADLPVTELSRPDPPSYTPLHYSPDINAFGRLGVGSYISPEAKFWGVSRVSEKSYAGGDLDFSSSDGHLDNQQSSYRFFNANGQYVTKLNEDTRLGFKGGAENSFNSMFNLAQSTNIPNSARKKYNGFHLGADLQQFKNTVTGWKAQANVRYFDASLKNAASLTDASDEWVYNGSVAKRWAGANVNQTYTIKAGVKGGTFASNQLSDQWMTAQGGFVYERLFNYSTKVKVDASVYYGTDAVDSKVYLGPSVTVAQPLMDILTLTVKAEAKPNVKTIEQLHSTNRFLNAGNMLRHSYNINASAEASLDYAKFGNLNLGVYYENISDRPIFMRDQLRFISPDLGFYEVNYADTYKLQAYASVVQQIIPDKFLLNAKVYLQSPQIQNGGRIPFEEKVGVNSGLTIRAWDRVTLEAWADYVGSRRTFQTNEKLNGFMLLGGQLDVQVTERFGAYVKLVNLLSQDYEVWQGYTERPFQAFGGVTIKL